MKAAKTFQEQLQLFLAEKYKLRHSEAVKRGIRMAKEERDKVMKTSIKLKITDELSSWCNECRLYAALFIIWNAELDELETIISEALDTLPGRVGPEEWHKAIRASIGHLPHCWLRDMSIQIDFLLESPCRTEECQVDCDRYWKRKRYEHKRSANNSD